MQNNKNQASPLIVIGIDPGYDRLGWAIGAIWPDQTYNLVACDYIQTNNKKPIFERYQTITQELAQIISQYRPAQASIENLYFSKNTKTALRVSEARGIIIGLILQHNIKIFEYDPNTIKKTTTGTGSADKTAVKKMIKLQLLAPNSNQNTNQNSITPKKIDKNETKSSTSKEKNNNKHHTQVTALDLSIDDTLDACACFLTHAILYRYNKKTQRQTNNFVIS